MDYLGIPYSAPLMEFLKRLVVSHTVMGMARSCVAVSKLHLQDKSDVGD